MNRRSLIGGIAAGVLACLTPAFTAPALAAGQNQARVTTFNIDKTVPPMQAVQVLKKLLEISRTRGPIFIIGYDSRLQDPKTAGVSTEAAKAMKITQDLYKDAMVLALNWKQPSHGRYSEFLMVMDLAYHWELDVGFTFRTDPDGPEKTPYAFATALVNGDRINMKGTPFVARNSKGQEVGKSLEGILVLQPTKSENALEFRARLFDQFEKLYDTATAQFVPPKQ